MEPQSVLLPGRQRACELDDGQKLFTSNWFGQEMMRMKRLGPQQNGESVSAGGRQRDDFGGGSLVQQPLEVRHRPFWNGTERYDRDIDMPPGQLFERIIEVQRLQDGMFGAGQRTPDHRLIQEIVFENENGHR